MRIAALFAAQVISLCCISNAFAQTGVGPGHEFPPGRLRNLDQLPTSRLKSELAKMPPPGKDRALKWLQSFHFTEADLPALHADTEGGIFYVCRPQLESSAIQAAPAPAISQAAVPVTPFPSTLFLHSKPGAPNLLYINFSGMTVSGTEWNNDVGRTEIRAVPFSTDSDFSTFSDAEQVAIKRIWQRMAEDYAPFNIDVTTEPPATIGIRTAIALITRTTDANGQPNPYDTAGGVAYVNVFGTTSYARFRPAWIYYDNLASTESYIAEAASHEVGHNMGLSHDGKTDGTEYYGGHGSGDVSWGPLMGTGYNRNVSQWSKGEYYLANNTQDDLATIAGKISYRTDDHGNTAGTATALAITGNTNIVSTTPENDPDNTNTLNKGVLERNTDLDVFSFVTGTGPVSISVKPWIMPAGTRGGNVDLSVALYDEAGVLLVTNNPATTTTALIQTNLNQGRYYLHVRNSNYGDPSSSTPSGYTAYGSIGQYFLNGYISAPTVYVAPPVAELTVTDLAAPGQSNKQFTVSYSDDVGINVSTIGTDDIRVLGPNGYDRMARFISLDANSNGTLRVATYAADPPSGTTWLPSQNGTYAIWMATNQVSDTQGAWVAAGKLGEFKVAVPAPIYSAPMDTDPGWTCDTPSWQYGVPSYSGSGPASGFTGPRIVAYNLSGSYPKNLSASYAKTPVINASGSSALTLRFMRWLGLQKSDTAVIQVSTNDSSWIDVWSSSAAVSDSSWQLVQYALPSSVAGSSTLRVRWGLASNGDSSTDIGWNIDDVEVLGDGNLDTAPPSATLAVANLTLAGSPSHPCSVTYSDASAVRLSSLDSTDLLVTGPGGYSNYVEFVGADLPSDGSPIHASYSILAPGGTWDSTDNGTYTIVLQDGAVQDTVNNTTIQAVLGTFAVSLQVAPIRVTIEQFEAATGRFQMAFQGQPGRSYAIQTSSDLISWSTTATVTAGTDGKATYQVLTSAATKSRFYRVMLSQ